ncbi:MAG: YitT family protein [Clostridiales bacterium]
MMKIEQNTVFRYCALILGSAVVAFGLAGFLVPHRIVAGGTSGLATIIYHLTLFPIGILVFVIDIPLFLWAFKVFGFKFLAKTFMVAMFLALFLQIFNLLIPNAFSPDPLLSAIYGGIITGAGMGIIFRFGATSGGTDLIAAIFRRYFHWKLGTGLFIADGFIILLSGLVFAMDLILYGILTVFICTRVVDIIQSGTASAKTVFVITKYPEAVKNAIYENVARGVTVFHGSGGFHEEMREILFSVVGTYEIAKLKDAVYSVDESAFVVVTAATEVLGEGFNAETTQQK